MRCLSQSWTLKAPSNLDGGADLRPGWANMSQTKLLGSKTEDRKRPKICEELSIRPHVCRQLGGTGKGSTLSESYKMKAIYKPESGSSPNTESAGT